jgi:hypothetical protein
MLELAVVSRIARDLMEEQFADPASRPTRTQAAAPAAAAPRAPVRRSAVRALRRVADRLEPAPRCATQ